MSIKQVIKYIQLRSELGPEELYLAESFASMTETDKQALMDMWGVKSKPSKPVTKRVIEKCDDEEGCGLTRRAACHKDTTRVDYHEFKPPQSSSKSKRASSIAERLPKPLGQGVKADEYGGFADDTDMQQCDYVSEDGDDPTTCGEGVDSNIHHKKTEPGYHPFVSSLSARNAVGQLSTNDDEVNSETGSEDVSVAAGG